MDADQAIKLLRTQHINRKTVDWPRVLRKAAGIHDTVEKVRYVITELHEPHTILYRPPVSRSPSIKTRVDIPPWISGSRVPTIHYPEYSYNPKARHMYVRQMFEAANHYLKDHSDPRRVTLDLRKNGGGDGVPMLMTLAMFLPLGTHKIGYLNQSGRRQTCALVVTDKDVSMGGVVLRTQNIPHLRPDSITVKVGRNTASSGEWLTICSLYLRRYYNVTYTGQTTGRFNSLNDMYEDPSGWLMTYTIGYYEDWKHNIYKGPLRLK